VSEANVEGEYFPPQRKLRKKKDFLLEEQSEEFQVFPETRSQAEIIKKQI